MLATRDVGCPGCGYNLRGLASSACGECGLIVTWEALLNRERRADAAWVVGMIGLAVALPESFLKWQRLAFRRLFFYGEQRWNTGPGYGYYDQPDATITNPWFVGSTLYWHLIPVALLAWWLMRQRIARLPRAVRWGLALGVFAAAFLGHRRQMFWYYLFDFAEYAIWPLWYINPDSVRAFFGM